MKKYVLIPLDESLSQDIEVPNACATPINTTSSSYKPDSSDSPIEKLSIDNILISIPKNVKHKAKAILTHIQNNSEKIDWNERGEILINNTKIDGSHIIDLIKCSLLPYKNLHPIGSREFHTSLKESNIPQTLIIQSGKGLPPPGIPIKNSINTKNSRLKWVWQKI